MTKRRIPKEEFALHSERSRTVRKIAIDHIKKHATDKEVAIYMSGGADSHFVLFAALEAGKNCRLYCATLEDRESRDFKCAYNTSKILGLSFTPVYLPTDIKNVEKYLPKLYDSTINPGILINKTNAEVNWVMTRMFARTKELSIITGMFGDAWYATSRSQKKLYDAGTFHAELVKYESKIIAAKKWGTDFKHWKGRDPQHIIQLGWLNKYHKGTKLIQPFMDTRMYDAMRNMDPIKEGWNPIQKAPWRLAFWEQFELCRENIYTNSPMQKGDSGIEEHFHKLLNTKMNKRGSKSTIGIYNDLAQLLYRN